MPQIEKTGIMESLTTLVSNWSVRIGDWANQGFRKVLLATTVCFALIIGTLENAMGQEVQDTVQYRWNIRTTFGNTYIGTIEQLENGAIRCQTENVGAITIQARNIRSMSVIDPSRFKDGKYYPENPLASKYFFGGSAYTVEKDQGIYRNTWVFINQFDFGITDNFSLGGGIIPFFLIAGGPTPVWLNSKVRFPVQEDKINLALNGLVGGVLVFCPMVWH